MPKGNRKGKGKKGASMNQNTKVPFKFVTTFNASSSGFTASNLELAIPNMGARLLSFATDFKKWRLIRLRIKGFIDGLSSIQIVAGNAGATLVSGFYGAPLSNVSAVPTTVAEIATFLYADLSNGKIHYSVPRSTLHESQNSDWMLCSTAGSMPAESYVAGTVFSAIQIGQTLTTGSVRAYIIYSGVVEFCEPTTPSVNLKVSGLGRSQNMPTIPDHYHIDDVECDEKSDSDTDEDEAVFEVASDWTDAAGDLPNLSKGQVADLFKKFQLLLKPVKAGTKPVAKADPTASS